MGHSSSSSSSWLFAHRGFYPLLQQQRIFGQRGVYPPGAVEVQRATSRKAFTRKELASGQRFLVSMPEGVDPISTAAAAAAAAHQKGWTPCRHSSSWHFMNGSCTSNWFWGWTPPWWPNTQNKSHVEIMGPGQRNYMLIGWYLIHSRRQLWSLRNKSSCYFTSCCNICALGESLQKLQRSFGFRQVF